MSRPDGVVAGLRERGALWSPAPGLVGLRGEALARFRTLEGRIRALCAGVAEEWLVPPAIPLDVLQRAGYFASFPQWLTVASQLTDATGALERLATNPAPAAAVGDAIVPPSAALPPAVCYHVYAALAGERLAKAVQVTAQCTCWRHEGARHAPLERGWAFTMREVVCVGTQAECEGFAERGLAIVTRLASHLGIDSEVAPAEDPFFAPTARGQALLQRVKGLKRELHVPIDDDRTVAAASVNMHERFFGDAFDIRAANGQPAFTACLAFGLERWLLASLVAEEPRTAVAS